MRRLLNNKDNYNLKEEIASSITHGIGVALAVAALVILVVFASIQGNPWKIVSFSIYGASMIILYMASTFYHAFQKPKVKNVFKIFDHASIYILIAGTYTPFTLVTIRGGWGWSIFGIIWGLAITGIFFKAFFIHRFKLISTLLYVLMGWFIVIAMKEVLANLDTMGLIWLIIGGVSYTGGVFFYLNDKIKFNHAIWHLFVLGGSICHFFAILFHVLPK
ncbi:MAG: hemolysin III family protein [Candidatus Cloacimonetes bacterium]|nr:hemolysin III family protein [Candidatus Neomarinimicrobiota bacterium]MCF7884846.1 hemolysin III family protein [Candidatus Cloacimonadota bacterium]